MKVGSYAFKGSPGINPSAVGANSYGGSVRTQSWGWTLLVVAVQSLGTQLDLYVQDSADDSSWAAVNGSPFQPAAAQEVYLVLIKNSAVREYIRPHMQGAGSPVASVAIVQIEDASGSLVGGCDLVID